MTLPEFDRLIQPGYWLDGFTGPPTPYTYVVGALFLIALIISVVFWIGRRRLFPGERIKIRTAARYAPWFFTFAAIGLFFIGLRILSSPLLTARLWWLLCLVALVATAVHLARYLRRQFPTDQARFLREEAQRRYLPGKRGRQRSARQGR